MANLSKTTIWKMREVIAAVLANAEFYDQGKFPQPEDCGAVCCAAGFTVWLNSSEGEYASYAKTYMCAKNWVSAAEKVLGLRDTYCQLFMSEYYWPPKFFRMYDRAKTSKGRAKAMAARWEHYIATDGKE